MTPHQLLIDKEYPYFIAEIGKNFIDTKEERSVSEYVKNAKKLIDAAKEAGADAVKFQTHVVDDEQLPIKIISPHFKGAERHKWVSRNTASTPVEDFWQPVRQHAERRDITFFSTPMSRMAAERLHALGVPFWKVGSGDVTDRVTLEFMARTKKPVVISTGMVSFGELREAVRYLEKRNVPVVVLYCISQYPAPPEVFNLSTLERIQNEFPNVTVGFSDHSLDNDVSLAAIKLGASVIEKHFSFDRDAWGADHKVSQTPDEFAEMVKKVREGNLAHIDDKRYYGRYDKELEGARNQFRPYFNKSLMAGRDLKRGHRLESSDVFAMRPVKFAGGIPADKLSYVVGKKLNKDIRHYEPITKKLFIESEPGKKRKICFVITSKIHFSRNKLILHALKKRKDVELQLILGGSAILDRYGDISASVRSEGFKPNKYISMMIEGGSTEAMTKSTGLGMIEFSSAFRDLDPDIIVIRGDRYEMLAATTAAAYMNKTIAHIEGGDVTGTIDESVRHAITKFAHIHFVTNKDAEERVIRMGEHPDLVHNVGSPDVEFASMARARIRSDEVNATGVGVSIDLSKPYIMVMQHSVTSEMDNNEGHTIETLEAVRDLALQSIWFWPNIDAGSEDVAGAVRRYRELYNMDEKTRFIKSVQAEKFIALLKNASCLVGNSSAGIKECSYLGVPVVNIGSRQQGRSRGQNVVDVPHDRKAISTAVEKQAELKRYPRDMVYYKKGTSERIADILVNASLFDQKRFED